MATHPLVYFEGRWPVAERALVEAAAGAAEKTRDPEAIQHIGAPWVALAHSAGESRIYFASRRGSSETLRAESAEALAHKIRQLGPSGPSTQKPI